MNAKLSTQPCGCDPGAGWSCSEYPSCRWGRDERDAALAALMETPACEHEGGWVEQPGEPPCDVCAWCGERRF